MDNRKKSGEILKNVGFTLLSEGKTIRIKAHGYSMYPCIKPGSLILIEPIKIKGNPVPGEIIAVKRESGLVVHRLSRIVVTGGITTYIARGDSNALEDDPITIGRIAGRVVGAESTGENPVPADITVNTRPRYFSNRLRVIGIILLKKVKSLPYRFNPPTPPSAGSG
ncbi:MAG: S24/S26 family peptidase, partial [Bacteroidia bacterium]|nr:S24/S26 family peptidase [Bacteroidia bacterium]